MPNPIQFIIGNGSDIDVSGPGITSARVFATGADEAITTTGVSDLIMAGAGNDTVNAGHGADTVFGDDGEDVINGGGGSDLLNAGLDNDTVDGGANDDTIIGGEGDDRIIGGNGDDVMYGDNSWGNKDGSLGADTFVFDKDDGNDRVWEFVHGVDTIELSEGSGYSLNVVGNNTVLTYGSTTVTFLNVTDIDASDIVF